MLFKHYEFDVTFDIQVPPQTHLQLQEPPLRDFAVANIECLFPDPPVPCGGGELVRRLDGRGAASPMTGPGAALAEVPVTFSKQRSAKAASGPVIPSSRSSFLIPRSSFFICGTASRGMPLAPSWRCKIRLKQITSFCHKSPRRPNKNT